MSKFRTSIKAYSKTLTFHHNAPVLGIGSCFTEHIGRKMMEHKFPVLINPFGIMYNPYSIGNSLEYLLKANEFTKEDLFEHNGLWHSFDHHGFFSKPDLVDTLAQINDAIKVGNSFLKQTKRLIITFGTSNVFVHKVSQKIVANCHKVPNADFARTTLSIHSILEKLCPLFEQLKSDNADLEILLTLSPVRHIRDGLVENQRSKARLILACEQLSEKYDYAHYFPAYEIMMDDLRDYRFYKSDMIHPNEVGIDYIWDYFSQCHFAPKTVTLNREISKIISAVRHRPIHPGSAQHQDFLGRQLKIIEAIEAKYSFLDFSVEKEELRKQLSDL